MRFAAISLILNTLGAIGLFFWLKSLGLSPHLGIAIATSLGGWLNAGLLYLALRRRGHFRGDRRLHWALPMILVSAGVMGLGLHFGADRVQPWLALEQPIWTRAAVLGAFLGGAAAVYFAMTFLTGALKIAMLRRAFRRR